MARLFIETELVDSEFGPWVEAYLTDGEGRWSIGSIPVNPKHHKPPEELGISILADALSKVVMEYV